jgi:hypothetical protein
MRDAIKGQERSPSERPGIFMSAETPRQNRGRVASLTRHRRPDDPELAAARLALQAANLQAYVERMIATAPTLTAEQRDVICALLRPADEGGAP